MPMPMHEEEVKAGAPEWVVTFGDMMSLLLCFFVLLLSFSTLEVQKFKVVAGYVRLAFGVQKETRTTEIPEGQTVVSVEYNPPSLSKEVIFERIVETIEATGLTNQIRAEIEDYGVRIKIDDTLLFETGRAELQQGAVALLAGVAATARESGARIIVEGHTDSVPIRSTVFPSNWELSGARAGAVVRYIQERDMPGDRLEAVGFADTQPVADNASAEGRRKNRRVELLLQPTE